MCACVYVCTMCGCLRVHTTMVVLTSCNLQVEEASARHQHCQSVGCHDLLALISVLTSTLSLSLSLSVSLSLCLSVSLSPFPPTGKRYISPKAEMMVNIASKLQQDVKAAVAPGGVATATTLDACQKEIFSLMVKDNFARFCKSTQGVALECMALARKAAGQE